MSQFAIERILWLDHHSPIEREWTRLAPIIEGADDGVTIQSYGLVIHETDHSVTIAGEEQLETPLQLPRYRSVITIMKALIVERERLNPERGADSEQN